VIERVIENWLDNSTERTFQLPFCYALQNEGHKIIHVSRHCGIEYGKDIITINPDGTPCAYQLKAAKNGRISLKQWRSDVEHQLHELVETSINHPSINPMLQHKSFIVTNGILEEEVSGIINNYNIELHRRGNGHHLDVINRGEMLSIFYKLDEGLLPTELIDIHTLLELYMYNGQSTTIDKEKFSSILISTLHLDQIDNSIQKTKLIRSIASAGLLCEISLSAFSKMNNYVAEIDTWIIYLSHVFACIECYDLDRRKVSSSINLGIDRIYDLLDNLSDELISRKHYVEGNALHDPWVYQIRMTKLISLMSIYGIWRRNREECKNDKDIFIKKFITDNMPNIYLWGEAAIPQFLAIYWYLRSVDATKTTEELIISLINHVTKCNDPREENHNIPLFYPSYDELYVLLHLTNIDGETLTNEEINTNFKGGSYSIEGLVHLLVRLNWKQEMKLLWPDVTRLAFYSFKPDELWQFYLWRNQSGKNIILLPKHRKEWEELKTEAMENDGNDIPCLIKDNYFFSLLFFQTYPHRFRADVMRWLDSKSVDRSTWKW